MELAGRLERHLVDWLGAWPPAGRLTIVGSEHRVRPGWDGKVYPVAGVATPDGTLHAVSNTASARVAEAVGFPDTGWRVLGLPVAS